MIMVSHEFCDVLKTNSSWLHLIVQCGNARVMYSPLVFYCPWHCLHTNQGRKNSKYIFDSIPRIQFFFRVREPYVRSHEVLQCSVRFARGKKQFGYILDSLETSSGAVPGEIPPSMHQLVIMFFSSIESCHGRLRHKKWVDCFHGH